MSRVWAILVKDIRTEYRTRYAVNALALFALVTLAAVSFALGGAGTTPMIQSALFWVILFFSALSGLSQSFVKEAETKTEVALKLGAPADAVFFGKMGFNLLLALGLAVLLVPLSQIMLGNQIHHWATWSLTVVCGIVGLVSVTTVLAALIAAANVKGSLFSVLSLPVLLPLLVILTQVGEQCLRPEAMAFPLREIAGLVAYAGIATTVGWLLFPAIWRA